MALTCRYIKFCVCCFNLLVTCQTINSKDPVIRKINNISMRRFFKILEKIVWALVAVAIIIVLILLAIGIITNYDVAANYISSLLPYFYLVAAVFLVFEASICGMKMYLDSKIEEETKRLQSTLENHRELQVTHEEKVTGKLDKLINDIAAFPRTSTVDFVDYLNKNLHGTVLSLANQIAVEKVKLIKQNLEAEYQKKVDALNERAFTVDAVLKKHDELERLKAEIAQKEKEECEIRLANTEEYVTLLFSLAKCPVEDVEKYGRSQNSLLNLDMWLQISNSRLLITRNFVMLNSGSSPRTLSSTTQRRTLMLSCT